MKFRGEAGKACVELITNGQEEAFFLYLNVATEKNRVHPILYCSYSYVSHSTVPVGRRRTEEKWMVVLFIPPRTVR